MTGGGESAVVATISNTPFAASGANVWTEVLLQPVRAVHFRYLGTEADSSWQSSWNEENLPRAIEVSIRDTDDLALAHRTVAIPKIAAAADCVFDVIALDCRRRTP